MRSAVVEPMSMKSASRSFERHERGARVPIGRGDVGGARSGLAELDEAGAARIEARGRRGEMIGRDRRQAADALLSRGKGVAQFAGHGDRVTVGPAQLSVEGVESGFEAVEPEPKRRRRLNRRFDAPVLHARRFQMRSPDVPTDDDAQSCSQIQGGDGRSERKGGSSASAAGRRMQSRAPVARAVSQFRISVSDPKRRQASFGRPPNPARARACGLTECLAARRSQRGPATRSRFYTRSSIRRRRKTSEKPFGAEEGERRGLGH